MDKAVLLYAEKTVNGELTEEDMAKITVLGIASDVADAALDIEETASAVIGDNITDDDDDGDELELELA